jgi:hypothetical protein
MTQQADARAREEERAEVDRLTATEQETRMRGTWLVRTGLCGAALATLCAVAWWAILEDHMPAAIVVPFYGCSFGAILLGYMETLGRNARSDQAVLLARTIRLEHSIASLTRLLPEEQQQTFYRGYAAGAQDGMANTGTEGRRRGGATGDVLRLHRNRPHLP